MGDFSAAGKPSKLYKIQDHPLRITAIIQQTLQMNIRLDIGLEIDMNLGMKTWIHSQTWHEDSQSDEYSVGLELQADCESSCQT